MQNEFEKMNRRGFLRLSTAALATASLASAQEAPKSVPLIDRNAEADPILLRSAQFELALSRTDGLPLRYCLLEHSAALRGDDLGRPVTATVCQLRPWGFKEQTATVQCTNVTGNAAEFVFVAMDADVKVAGFTLRYVLEHATVTVTLHNLVEVPGYELISVHLPRLVSISSDDPNAWLVHGDTGGSLTMLEEATAGSLAPNQFWGEINGTLPVVMVGHSTAMCVMETTAFMDGTLVEVLANGDKRRAAIGTTKLHRVNGGDCYDMNLPKGMSKNCGNAQTPNLLVEQVSSCRLDFLPVTGDVRSAWLQGAKLVRRRMPEIPSNLYHDKYAFGIRCDEPLFPKPSATFAQCKGLIGAVHALTDGAPQIVHLWGWQFKGKDTGYPAVNLVNERIGGYDGMMSLMQAGRSLNAIVTLSDNYDDAYRSSPAWDERYIARRPDGDLWKSREWTGEESYIIGMAKFMTGPGAARVRYTCERYRLRETTHVDVLSYFAIRNDWDHERPASGIKNLQDGRYRVLEEFKKRSVDVTSEALRYPMIGRISCFWYAQTPGTCPFGGTAIPLLPLVYGKSAVWGYSGGSHADHSVDRLQQLFYGSCPHSILRADTPLTTITDTWYLGLLPWFHLHRLEITGFQRNGNQVQIKMGNAAAVAIDFDRKTYTVMLDGQVVAREDSVFCPYGKDKLVFYALTDQVLRAPLPAGWKQPELTAMELTESERKPAEFHITNGAIEVSVRAQRPVMIHRTLVSKK